MSRLARQKSGVRMSMSKRAASVAASCMPVAESVRLALVARVQAEAEEQPEHVREVVEGAPGAVIVRLDGPHVRVRRARVQPVTVGLALRFQHQLVQLIHRKLPRAPPLEDALL